MFLARGFSHKEGEDYDETFSPLAMYTYIRSIISIASVMGWKLQQMDVKTALLNGITEEEVYIEKTKDFVIYGKEFRHSRRSSGIQEGVPTFSKEFQRPKLSVFSGSGSNGF